MNTSYLFGQHMQAKASASPACPHCHSIHIRFVETRQLSAPENTSVAVFSPMALANIGMQLSRRLDLPPMLGGFAGLVIGGAVLFLLNYQNPIQIQQYYCEQCQESFEAQNITKSLL